MRLHGPAGPGGGEDAQSYRHVDLVFGPHALWQFPELLYSVLTQRGRVFSSGGRAGLHRRGHARGAAGTGKGLGVHHVRLQQLLLLLHRALCPGPGALPRPEEILAEVQQLVAEGYRDITLLGQNVNSYGKDLEERLDFADLLARDQRHPGDFLIRFMTSHPKDATQKLFETMARCGKVAPVLHLPVQAGNDRVLQAMNRHYDRAQYLDEVGDCRQLMPDIVLTSDVIVGFPGETTEEFEETLSLVEQVRFDALFTFIFSPGRGRRRPAGRPHVPGGEAGTVRAPVDLQNRISAEKHAAYVGQTLRCLVDGDSGDARWHLTARTAGRTAGAADGATRTPIGEFRQVKITDSNTWALFGEVE